MGIEPRPLTQESEATDWASWSFAEGLKVLNPYMSCSIDFDIIELGIFKFTIVDASIDIWNWLVQLISNSIVHDV